MKVQNVDFFLQVSAHLGVGFSLWSIVEASQSWARGWKGQDGSDLRKGKTNGTAIGKVNSFGC